MKTIKNTALVLMGVLMMSSVSAQKKAKLTDEEKAAKHVTRLTKKLDLDDKQVVKLEDITSAHITSTKDLRQEMQELREKQKALKEKLKVKKEEHKDQIKDMLNEDQLEKFEEMEKKRMERQEKKKAERKAKREKKHEE